MIRILLILIFMAPPLAAQTLEGPDGPVRVSGMASGLDDPWSFAFLPDGSVLIAEKTGRLWRVQDRQKTQIRGVGPVAVVGQGGLLDVLVPRDFEQTRQVYFTHAIEQGSGVGTALATANLGEESGTLSD
jgi:glucose/arabinose dehydrogenase